MENGNRSPSVDALERLAAALRVDPADLIDPNYVPPPPPPRLDPTRLRAYRAAAGYTQTDLAELVGSWQGSVSAWERGATAPRGETVERLADALGIDADALYMPGGAE